MTTADVPTMTTTPHGRRPRPGPGILAELTETPAGWVLSLRCDEATAAALQSARLGQGPGALTVSIAPNLVPGEPFSVHTVLISVDDTVDGTAATTH